MGDVISTMQGGPELQHRVFDSTVCALKWLLPSLPRESKYLVIFKKLLLGEGDWACAEEVQDWTIDTEVVTVTIPEHKIQ